MSTTIDWTDKVWNPVLGCRRVSAGCQNCLIPDTPILYADMVWRPIGEARVGDSLIAFDEENEPGLPRKFQTARILAVWVSRRSTVRMIGDNVEVVTTPEHRWLTANSNRWVKPLRDNPTQGIRPGHTMLRSIGVTPTPMESEDYRLGYIVGMTTGDGTVRYQPGQRSDKLGYPQCYWRVALAQPDEAVLGRLVRYLALIGIGCQIKPFDPGRANHTPMLKVETRRLDDCRHIHGLMHNHRDTVDFRRGFLAGFFDAEGSGSDNLRVSQVDREILQRFNSYAQRLGFSFATETGQHGSRAGSSRLRGTLLDRIRFFSTCAPALYRKAGLSGLRMQQTNEPIRHVEHGSVHDVVDIQTTTGTFYAAGLASHNCYAERMAHRLAAMGQTAYAGLTQITNSHPQWTGVFRELPERLDQPLRWRKPKRVFVNSMSDLFGEGVSDEFITAVFSIIRLAKQHQFQILTKRPGRMAAFMPGIHGMHPLPNCWLGVSVEDQQTADTRIPLLLQTPAAVRFLSCEPLLWPVRISDLIADPDGACHLHWVIAGAESGPGARPMDLDWVRSLRDECREANVAFFFKQSATPAGQKIHTPVLDGHRWMEYPS